MTDLQIALNGLFGTLLIVFALLVDVRHNLASKFVFKVMPFFMGLAMIGMAFGLVA